MRGSVEQPDMQMDCSSPVGACSTGHPGWCLSPSWPELVSSYIHAFQVTWATLWKELRAFVVYHGTRCIQIGDAQLVQAVLDAEDMRGCLQDSINSMGYQESVTSAELDLAVYEHLTLLDNIVYLLRWVCGLQPRHHPPKSLCWPTLNMPCRTLQWSAAA